MTLEPLILAAATAPNQPLAIVLLTGAGLLTIGLGVLMWTRWGQAQPLGKCVGLSVFAHLLLLIYAYATQVFYAVPGNPESEVFEVRLVHTGDDEDASPWVDPDAEVVPPDDLEQFALGGDEALPDEAALATQPPAAAPPGSTAPQLLEAPPEPAPAETERVADADLPAKNGGDELPAAMADVPEPERIDPATVAEANQPEPPAAAVPEELPASPLEQPNVERRDLADANVVEVFPAPGAAATDVAQPSITVSAPATPRRAGDGQAMPKLFTARVAADRLQVAQQHGGDVNTEAAVAGALQWLATHQSADGRWDADLHGAGRETALLGHDRGGAGARGDTGITGLALLALLGAGNTHLDGEYREQVQRGLEFLLRSQLANGSLQGDAELFASMYCHGIATLALSEAYAMTGDPRLKEGVRRAIGYTLSSQHSAGGWRYQPGDAGDMSQFGWQVMALKSAEIGGFPIPDETRVRMTRFLRSVTSGRHRGLASYRTGERPSRTMTAEALVCRTLAGIENSAGAMDEGGRFILEQLPGSGQTDLYYYYYATLAIYQRQGSDWDRWNAALQRELLPTQRRDGDAAGSWDSDALWGSYGGRVYSTALAALCLEVYYRYLPLYENDFPVDSRWTERPRWPVPLPR